MPESIDEQDQATKQSKSGKEEGQTHRLPPRSHTHRVDIRRMKKKLSYPLVRLLLLLFFVLIIIALISSYWLN